MDNKYIPTGNEMISIPTINEKNASIQSVNFLHMGFKGLIEISGSNDSEDSFMRPEILVNGHERKIDSLKWDRIKYWIPSFKTIYDDMEVTGVILAPVKERGFIYQLKVTNTGTGNLNISLGLKGCWKDSIHTINESKVINGIKDVYKSGWNNSFVCDMRSIITVFSFAPIFEENMDAEYFENKNDEVRYEVLKEIQLEPGKSRAVVFYWGFGMDEVSSATSAKEMMRKGYERELEETTKWLTERCRTSKNKNLDKIFNLNLFFNFFYASGITMDTEEFVLVTSRSPRYYVSAAYWDRDSLLWSFPSILIADPKYAKEMLEYVFTKQIKNVGNHSRYIDGTLLEPGFELDELCAPVIALYNYVNYTKDMDILSEKYITKGIKRIIDILKSKKNEQFDLYETFLQPTDDMAVYPYLTYDNVLVWKLFTCLSEMYKDLYGDGFQKLAYGVEKAIWENCVFEHEGEKIFSWSVDLKGHHNIYDEPPGSLQLLPFYGFCSKENEVYKNTIVYIRRPEYEYSFSNSKISAIGCAHAPHPWILSIANSLVSGEKQEFLSMLPLIKMDNGIACESVDENTGECATGEAFATCAGFLSYSIYHEFYDKNE